MKQGKTLRAKIGECLVLLDIVIVCFTDSIWGLIKTFNSCFQFRGSNEFERYVMILILHVIRRLKGLCLFVYLHTPQVTIFGLHDIHVFVLESHCEIDMVVNPASNNYNTWTNCMKCSPIFWLMRPHFAFAIEEFDDVIMSLFFVMSNDAIDW